VAASRVDCRAKSHRPTLDVPSGDLRIWRFVEGNPVNDGVVFWIRAVAYDLAVKILSDTPAGGVLYGHPIGSIVRTRPCTKRKDGAPHCVGDANEIKSPGHPPVAIFDLRKARMLGAHQCCSDFAATG
jgi:hypothetical protein